MTDPLVLAPIGPGMAPLLASLHAAAFPEAPWSEEACSGLINSPGNFGWIAALGETPGGFVLARGLVESVEIVSLGVAPPVRRQGLARRLLATVLDQATKAGAGRLLLEVAEDNGPARAFYAAAGFALDGRRRGYYRRPGAPAIDALLLSLPLDT